MSDGEATLGEIQVHVSRQDSADDDRLYVWNNADEHTQEEDRAGEESETTQSPPAEICQLKSEMMRICCVSWESNNNVYQKSCFVIMKSQSGYKSGMRQGGTDIPRW